VSRARADLVDRDRTVGDAFWQRLSCDHFMTRRPRPPVSNIETIYSATS
jgi:hypothetical protein